MSSGLFKNVINKIYLQIIYVVYLISFQPFLYGHLKLSKTIENSVCYCYTSYEMTDQFL